MSRRSTLRPFVAALILAACAGRARGEEAATVYYDAKNNYSLGLPGLDIPEGGKAVLAELLEPAATRAKGFASGVTISVRRLETTREAYADKFLLELAKAKQKILNQEKKTIDAHDALVIDTTGKVQGEECRALTLLAFTPKLIVIVQIAHTPAVFTAREAALRAAVESLRFGPPLTSGSYFASTTYGFSIAVPEVDKAKPADEPRLLVARSLEGDGGVAVALGKPRPGTKDAVKDALAEEQTKKGAKVTASGFTTVSEHDAVLLEVEEKAEKRFVLSVLDKEWVLTVTCSAPAAAMTLREQELRGVFATVRLGPPVTPPRVDAGPKPPEKIPPVAPKAEPPAPAAAPTTPAIQSPAIVRPVFTIDGTERIAGTAFALKTKNPKVLLVLTALHVFEVPGADLPTRVTKLGFHDMNDEKDLGPATEVLALPGTFAVRKEADGNVNASGDVAAAYAPATVGLKPLTLAAADPKVGDKVWLAARLADGAAAKLHEGKVVEVSGTRIDIHMPSLKEREQLQATSGAPWVNVKGEVVGIHLGGLAHPAGGVIAFSNPASSVAKHVDAALRKK